MKKGDKIIWDSGFGYDIGYFIEETEGFMYNTHRIELITGGITGEMLVSKYEVKKYSPEALQVMQNTYE